MPWVPPQDDRSSCPREHHREEPTVYPNPALDAELAYRRELLRSSAGRRRTRSARRTRWLG